MAILRLPLRFRLGALLCIALLALFAGMSLSRSMDRLQHGPGAPQSPAHLLFGALSAEDAHDASHHVSSDNQDDRPDRLPDGHHHHGDSSSAFILLVQATPVPPLSSGNRPDRVIERADPSSAVGGPDRPPRLFPIRV